MSEIATKEQPEELVITLRRPVQLGDITYRELKLREPTAAEWAQWGGMTGPEADIKAVAIVSGLPEAVIRKIGVRDVTRAAGYIAGFFD